MDALDNGESFYSAEVRVRHQVSPCNNYGEQTGTRTDFSPSATVFNCQSHSLPAPCSCQKDKRAKPETLPKAMLFRKSEINEQKSIPTFALLFKGLRN